MNKRAIIIQARNGSSRFPNKMISLIDDKGRSVFEFLLTRLKYIFSDQEIYLATTCLQQDDVLCNIATDYHVSYFKGSEEDVLDRFIKCAKKYNISEIIRICADNPFINLEDLLKLKYIDLKGLDYVSFYVNGKPSIKTHYGFWGELLSLQALQKISSMTDNTLYREHVTNFIYENPNLFKIKWLYSSTNKSFFDENIRLTLDTEDDLRSIKSIIRELDLNSCEIKIEDIYRIVRSRKDILNSMSNQIRRNLK